MNTLNLNKTIIRGDQTELSFQIAGALPFSDGDLKFTAKASTALTATRIIDVDAIASYDSASGITDILVALSGSDTQNITQQTLYFDVTNVSISDSHEEFSVVKGLLNVKFDVRTPFDSTVVETELYVPVKRSSFNDGEFIKAVNVNGQLEFQGYASLKNGLFDLDLEGNLMPKETVDTDDIYELDANGDIMPIGVI